MLEIAAGILLAIVVLLFVLANLGWIVVGLSAIFAAGIAIVGTVLIFSLPRMTEAQSSLSCLDLPPYVLLHTGRTPTKGFTSLRTNAIKGDG
jgi:hypothetical protein